MAAENRAKLEKQMKETDAKMKSLVAERENESKKLKSMIEQNEKKADGFGAQADKNARARQAQLDKELKKAEANESAAKAEYGRKKAMLDKDYKAKFDGILKSEIAKVKEKFTKEFKEERKRETEYLPTTNQIYDMMADSLAKNGLKKLKDEDLSGARKDFYQALKVYSENKLAKKGLAEMDKTAEVIFNKAYKLLTEDKDQAKELLKKLVRNLPPKSEFFVRAKALLENM